VLIKQITKNITATQMVEVSLLSSPTNEAEKRIKNLGTVDIFDLDISQLIEVYNAFDEKAWRYIGLKIDPHTTKISKDLAKAHTP
jgi:hypothetical protein